MKTRIILALLAITLAACAPAVSSTPTETPSPTATSTAILPTFTPTAEMTPDIGAPTPYPTLPPPPIFTPDAIQVERWKEYQTELARALFSYDPNHLEGYDPEAYKDAICEWDILGKADQKVYVWAECLSGLSLKTNPAVIYLEPDGSLQKVIVPDIAYREQTKIYDLHLFSIGIQEKLCLYYFYGIVSPCEEITPAYYLPDVLPPRGQVLVSHLKYRQSHAEEPPLIVLSATPTP